jgi:GNAT superfamily N-acetyltransferase
MEKRYSVRKFSMSDVSGIVRLLNIVFKPTCPFTEEWWLWKYQNNPAGFWGERGDTWIAEDKGKIVGHYAVIPLRIKIDSGTAIAGQSVDTAVHPEYRRMGIFSTLARKVYADIQDRYSFLFGYPSEMAYRGFLDLGWKDYPVNELVKFIDYERPLGSLLSSNLYAWAARALLKTWQTAKRVSSIQNINRKFKGEDVTMERKDKFEDELDAFWRIEREESTVVLERTVSYLNWRFSKIFGDYQIWVGKSVRDGRVIGYSVFRRTNFRKVKNVLDIVDLCALPKEDKFILSAIDLSLKISEEKDLDLIHVRVPIWHDYNKIISSRGFIGVESVLSKMGIYQPRLILYDFKDSHMNPTMKGWFYSLADTDYA